MKMSAIKLLLIWATSLVIVGCQKREEPPVLVDDPITTNDESNDQPVGSYGDQTMTVITPHNGAEYTLDVEMDGTDPSKLYFPKGGHVDLTDCSQFGNEWNCQNERGEEVILQDNSR